MKIRSVALSLALLACAALPAAAAAHGSEIFEMKRDDMRVTLHVRGGEVVRAHVKARERCGRNGPTGLLEFNLLPPEAIPIRNGHFDYDETFDDARGHGRIVLEGGVNPRTIRGVFLFSNLEDTSCGTGRPGKRRVLYTARLQS